VPCRSYGELTGKPRFEQWVFQAFLNHRADEAPEVHARTGLVEGMSSRSREATGVFQHFINYLNEDYIRRGDPEAHQQGGVRVISAGPNAFLYVLEADRPLDIDALDRRFPGLAAKLSEDPGVGFVLARSAEGPVCFRRGKRHHLGTSSGAELFAMRPDAALVVEGIQALMKMPSAGDLVIYGTDATSGHVSFLPEWGSHAGPSHDEMHTFIVHPPHVTLPGPIRHPVQLYDHFIRYQQDDGV
jgi:hypothetical protein